MTTKTIKLSAAKSSGVKMNNRFEVIWSKESLTRRNTIKKYLEVNWTSKEVLQFYQLLKNFERIVSQFPRLYQKSSSKPDLRRAVISKHQSIIYSVHRDEIKVITILDNRMDNS